MSRDQAQFTVKLIDEVKGPAKSATRALEALNVANKRLQRSEKSADRASIARSRANRMQRDERGRFIAGSGKGGGIFGGALSILGGNLMTTALSKVASLVGDIGKAGYEMVTFGQNTRMALDALAKHGATGEELFKHASSLATRFGLDLEETTGQYKKFLALQFSPKAADELIRLGADMRSLGNSAEEVQGIFLALGQVKGKGKLQAEELMQLGERGLSQELVHEEIGKLLGGKTTAEVQKLQQSGGITADVGLQGIKNAIMRKLQEDHLGQRGGQYADKTIEGMLGRVKALGQNAMLGSFNRTTAPITELIGKGLSAFEGFLTSDAGAKTMERIAQALGDAATYAKDFVVAFGGAFSNEFKSRIVPLIDSISGVDSSNAKELGAQFATVAANVLETITRIGVLADKVASLANGPLGKLLGVAVEGQSSAVKQVGGALGGASDALTVLGDEKKSAGEKARGVGKALLSEGVLKAADIFGDNDKAWGDKAWEIGKLVAVGFGKGVVSSIAGQGAVGMAGVLAEGAVDKMKSVLDIHSPSRVTEAIGVNVGKGFAIGIRSTEPLLLSAGDQLGSAPLQGMEEGFHGPEVSSLRGPSVDGSGGGGGGMGDVRVSLTQHIQSGGDAMETAKLAAREARREMEAFFRQLAMEAG